jgi:hypothetical protein
LASPAIFFLKLEDLRGMFCANIDLIGGSTGFVARL